MKLVFEDNRGYEAFQIIWIALTKGRMTAENPARLVTLHGLMCKLVAISHEEGEKRLLNSECEIELTPEEQLMAVEAMAITNWRVEMFPHVRSACGFLGAEFERPTRLLKEVTG